MLRCKGHPTFACVYFFFDNRTAQADQSLHHKFLRSIIRQLADNSDEVPAPLVDLYGHGNQQPLTASLQLTAQKLIGRLERAYIIIDALDECTDRERTLMWIEQLIQWKSGKVQILISSRPEADIRERFDSSPSVTWISLVGRSADADIEVYVNAMLARMVRWDAQITERVRHVLIAGAHGM